MYAKWILKIVIGLVGLGIIIGWTIGGILGGGLGGFGALLSLIAIDVLKKKLPKWRMNRLETKVWKMEAKNNVKGLIRKLNYKSTWDSYKIRRQAAKALGRIKNVKAVEGLNRALKDEEDSVRKSAAKALGEIKEKRAVEPLIQALKNNKIHWTEKDVIAESLEKIGDLHAIDTLIEYYPRTAAATLLKKIKLIDANWSRGEEAKSILPKIIFAIPFGNEEFREAARDLLKETDPNWLNGAAAKKVAPDLISLLKIKGPCFHNYAAEVGEAAKLLGEMKDVTAVEALINIIDKDSDGSQDAVWALGEIKDRRAIKSLIIFSAGSYSGGNREVITRLENKVRKVEHALEKIDPNWFNSKEAKGAIEPLIREIGYRDIYSFDGEYVEHIGFSSLRAIDVLSKIGIPAIESLILALETGGGRAESYERSYVKDDAERILYTITGQKFGDDPLKWRNWWMGK